MAVDVTRINAIPAFAELTPDDRAHIAAASNETGFPKAPSSRRRATTGTRSSSSRTGPPR